MRVLAFIRQRSFAAYVMADLAEAAGRLGWDVRWLDMVGRMLRAEPRPDAERRALVAAMVDEARAARPHVVFSYGLEYLAAVFERFVPGDDRTLAGVIGRPVVYFLFDFGPPLEGPPTSRGAAVIEALQSPTSLVFCWDREALGRLHQLGILRARHFPMAVNGRVFSGPAARDPAAADDIPVIFAGGSTPERVHMLEAISTFGPHIYAYDEASWNASPALATCVRGPVVDRAELAARYRRARISVNVTRPHGRSSLNMRVFEAMACGCLMLTDEKADAHDLFLPGQDLVMYRDDDDLRRLVEHFVSREAERERIAAHGRATVHERHTYDLRMQSAAPTIERFLRQAEAFARLEAMANEEPSRGLAFARYLAAERLVPDVEDHLHVTTSRLLAVTGDRRGAARHLGAALRANPACLAARRLGRDLQVGVEGPDVT